MHTAHRTAQVAAVIAISGASLCSSLVRAETPGEIPKPWTYEGSKRLQEQQQQNQQPQQQAPAQSGTRPMSPGNAPGAAALEAARRTWMARPALPPDRNPLLGGKWARPASTKANSNDPFAQLQALAKGGLCEALFGGGVFEFRPDRMVGMDGHTPEQELDRVEYRGDAKHVVVLPKTTLKLIEFDFEGPDRINWTGQNCVLVRVNSTKAASGAAVSQKVASAPSAGSAAAGSAATSSAAGSGGVLTVVVGPLSPTDKIAGRKLWVLRTDPQFALIKAGVTSTPYASVLQNWMRACDKKEQLCFAGMQALQPHSVGFLATDANGQARTPPLPPGRYWVLCDAKVDNKRVAWDQPVDVKAAGASLTFDRSNVIAVD